MDTPLSKHFDNDFVIIDTCDDATLSLSPPPPPVLLLLLLQLQRDLRALSSPEGDEFRLLLTLLDLDLDLKNCNKGDDLGEVFFIVLLYYYNNWLLLFSVCLVY